MTTMLSLRKLKLLFLLIIVLKPVDSQAVTWQKISGNPNDADLRTLAIDSASSIYIGSKTALYQSTNQGKDFKAVFYPSGEQKAVHQIYISPQDPNRIYAATEAGLFESKNAGKSWQQIFSSSNKEERNALCVIEDKGVLFLGTQNGLFSKNLSETTWRRMETTLNHDPIYFSGRDEKFIYFATDEKLFRFDKGSKMLKLIFTVGFGRSNEESEESDDESDSESESESYSKSKRGIKFLEVGAGSNPKEGLTIFLAAKTGIYFSQTQGKKWERLETTNIPVEQLTSLKVFRHGCPEGSSSCFSLFAATTKGAFLYQNKRWEAVYQGMETNDIRDATVDPAGNIYAATNSSLFLLSLEKALPSSGSEQNAPGSNYKTLSESFSDEPSIQEIHCLAIDYAELNQKKIKNWRELASKRAIMPALTTGLNRGAGPLHWDSGANPDELLKGEETLDWDISLKWDLADLVWNASQTSIEIRSVAMVELREDILDQITRLYFERRRAQAELIQLASLDPQMRLDKEMRVEELTALIDAMTGGKFSETIEKNRQKKTQDAGHKTQNFK